jgi:transposase
MRVEYLRKGAEVSQSETGKAGVADQRSDETRSFVRQVRAATRRKYTPEEKIRIVLEGFRREVTVNDLCRREGIKPHSYYAWTKEFMEAGKERLTRDAVRDATRQEILEFRRENGELKQLVGELSLQVSRLKKTAIPTLVDGAGTRG